MSQQVIEKQVLINSLASPARLVFDPTSVFVVCKYAIDCVVDLTQLKKKEKEKGSKSTHDLVGIDKFFC